MRKKANIKMIKFGYIISSNMICENPECFDIAKYGYKTQRVMFCKNCKKDGMVVTPLQYCEHGKV